MSNEKVTVRASSSGVLTIVFIVLKLCHVINWSWWWVLSPLWISVGLVILIIIPIIVFSVIFKSMTEIKNNKAKNNYGNKEIEALRP